MTRTPSSLPLPSPHALLQPLLAVFPHGLQHRARRNAYQAMGLAAACRRDRAEADAAVRTLLAAQMATRRVAAVAAHS